MVVKWLSFADIHYNFKNSETLNLREQLLRFISDNKFHVNFVLIAGDCLYQVKSTTEIDKTVDFIHKIVSYSGCDRTKLYITPGNHDVERTNERMHQINYYTGINYATGKAEKGFTPKPVGSNIDKLYTSEFKKFSELYLKATGREYTGKNMFYDEMGYRIININTCLLSCSDYDEGHISAYNDDLINKCNQLRDDEKINIVFMHYGLDFFRKNEMAEFQNLLEDSYVDIVFSGHSHKIGIKTYDGTENRIRQFTCGAVVDDNYSQPSFYYCEYNTDTHEVICKLYSFNAAIGRWGIANLHRQFSDGVCKFNLVRSMHKTEKTEKTSTQAANLNTYSNDTNDNGLKKYGILEALTLSEFNRRRNELVSNASGHIMISGQSLENAFDVRQDCESLVRALQNNKKIKQIDIFLTDPIMFDSTNDVVNGDTPISRIESSMHTILHDIARRLEDDQEINIYFIPLVQFDHMVFANGYLLLRHTLLWTNDNYYKATPLVCVDISNVKNIDQSIVNSSMYHVYSEYLKRLKGDCIYIDINQNGKRIGPDTLAKKCHREWRDRLANINKSPRFKGKITMYKLYRKQLINDLHSTWDPRFRSFTNQITWADEGESSYFKPSEDNIIATKEDLYNTKNLLNDTAQKILLPYIKETEILLNGLIKKYDKEGEAHVFPSLDIGFPNNIQRLAGGFATGMFLMWKSGTPIVPVDTTVNVCSSSYYEIDTSSLRGKEISSFFNETIINRIIKEASTDEGLAFSFDTGNHFLLLCKSKNTGKYFLVLHSSAKQFKDTFLGLYPKPGNWYSAYVKQYSNPSIKGRYINYLKDREAERFINIARSLNEQNKDIHNWFAKKISQGQSISNQKTFHHYGMPTDYSIAIGTYVVDEADIVPIFSKEGYQIYLFRASDDMWSIELKGKRKFIVPHGWGQTINFDNFADKISYEDREFCRLKIINDKLVLVNSKTEEIISSFEKTHSSRFTTNQLIVRDLYRERGFDGRNIFGSTPYLKGTIEDILYPIALYSRDTNKSVKYYNKDNENEPFVFS